ncbi:putative alkaline shock family protein YloU [Arthrobacter sp. CAN_A212]|uniref:Asp23/Gls24 family envelope stress response protein n=1 Tax=unclassified Arthrobacter TaxID=235627 RepID=UPI0018CA171B|nr:Asp23/Gls24 family envelope stress response protein [Arthrobacter sp. CAN_C5]MBP2217909.1 putative alkaline shock family protein YloU [Arthrobacter sp. CAN_C5]
MSTQPQDKLPTTASPTPAVANRRPATAAATAPAGKSQHDGDRGATSIADNVVAKIAGIALRDIPGVYALGGGAARALGSIRGAVGQKEDHTRGISVEVGQTQVAVDVTLVVEYPHPLKDVADQVRDAIYSAVEDLVGMEVTEVNVTISDIHVPGDDTRDDDAESAPTESRVS